MDFETTGNIFVGLNRFWITLIPSLAQEYYCKKHRFTVTSSLLQKELPHLSICELVSQLIIPN